MNRIGLKELFVIFLRAGLAFGGGLGILAVLEDELVTKRQALTREEFLADYALGRIVPSGTMSALAGCYLPRGVPTRRLPRPCSSPPAPSSTTSPPSSPSWAPRPGRNW